MSGPGGTRRWGQRSWAQAAASVPAAPAFVGVDVFALTGGLLLPDLSC